MMNAFEHSFRGISKEFDDKIYPLNPNFQPKLGGLFPNIMSKSNLLNAEMNTFIEIVLEIRNSIHNNGVFVSTKAIQQNPYLGKIRPIIFTMVSSLMSMMFGPLNLKN